VRLSRAELSGPAEIDAWQAEVEQHFAQEIQYHFAAEEAEVFPIARHHGALAPLVDELIAEHGQLRQHFAQAQARALSGPDLRRFAEMLSTHIRKEERQLFEEMQQHLTPAELATIGKRVAEALAATPQACITPTEEILKTSRS
jgi:hemerythrin-like domain-containing protein